MQGQNEQFLLVLAIHQIFICVIIRYFVGISDCGRLICLPKSYAI